MSRRSFRSGIVAGLLTGLVIALVRVLQARRSSSGTTMAPPSAWPPVPSPDEAAEPGMEAPSRSATVATPPDLSPDPSAATEPATRLEPEPLVADDGAGAGAGPGAGTPGLVTEQPAGRSEPLGQPWVECTSLECPASHPVKAKLSSGIFHVPGGLNYARCKADRCYVSEEAAEADGFTKAKR